MSMPGFELVSPSHSNLVDYLKFFPILSAAILLLHLSAITRAPIHSPKAFRRRMARPVVSSRVNLDSPAPEDQRVAARRAIDLSDVPPVLENPVSDVVWLLIVAQPHTLR
ncbi:hypothetical protein B0H14DRAFT_3463933 [Mycena olivaceomarginata]|nr:hypothetical protein B0H14DRAFT_3463933 [Mycena olivaceomarginata]